MPKVEELPDRNAPPPSLAERQALSAVGGCLTTLRKDRLPLSSRYREVLSRLQPVGSYLQSNPAAFPAFEDGFLVILQPDPQLAPVKYTTDDDDNVGAQEENRALRRFQFIAEKLFELINKPSATPDIAILLATFSDPLAPWTSEKLRTAAEALITPELLTPEILIDGLLRDVLKPLFTATPSTSNITPAGRRAIAPTRPQDSSIETPPWLKRPDSLSILTFALRHLPSEHLETAWPLLIPPILAIIDSSVVPAKTRGINLLSHLLKITPETHIERTGIAPVFWDALLPALLFLPPLTPQKDAASLLTAAYNVLLRLLPLRAATPVERGDLGSVLVRDGFLKGKQFAGEYPVVMTVELQALQKIVEAMGVYAVRHLGELVPVVSETLADPFVEASPGVAGAALEVLGTLVKVCWARIAEYRAEILRGVVVCWGRVKESEVKLQMRRVVDQLRDVVVSEVGKEVWITLEEGVKSVEGCEALFEPPLEAGKRKRAESNVDVRSVDVRE